MWSNNYALIVICVIGGACALASEVARRRRLAPLFNRPCAGREWRRRFPDAPKEDVRRFLQMFVDSYSLEREHYLAFRPDDQIMEVYRTINSPKWTVADSMELETFAFEIERHYGFPLKSIWRDELTLGEIFSRARAV